MLLINSPGLNLDFFICCILHTKSTYFHFAASSRIRFRFLIAGYHSVLLSEPHNIRLFPIAKFLFVFDAVDDASHASFLTFDMNLNSPGSKDSNDINRQEPRQHAISPRTERIVAERVEIEIRQIRAERDRDYRRLSDHFRAERDNADHLVDEYLRNEQDLIVEERVQVELRRIEDERIKEERLRRIEYERFEADRLCRIEVECVVDDLLRRIDDEHIEAE